ncbi:MAG: hypothetical protein ACRCY4_07625 [Brevinema sp.]
MLNKEQCEFIAAKARVHPVTIRRFFNEPSKLSGRIYKVILELISEHYPYLLHSLKKQPGEAVLTVISGGALEIGQTLNTISLFGQDSALTLLTVTVQGEISLNDILQKINIKDSVPMIRGVVFINACLSPIESLPDIPIVCINMESSPYALNLNNDDFRAGLESFKVMEEKGFSHPVYILEDTFSTQFRLNGFRTLAKDVRIVLASSSTSSGYEATLRVLDQSTPDFLVYGCDEQALGGYLALHQKGLVPQKDVGILGFGNLDTTKVFQLDTFDGLLEQKFKLAIDYILYGALSSTDSNYLDLNFVPVYKKYS